MNEQRKNNPTAGECLTLIEEYVRCRLARRVLDFQLIVRDQGLVLMGHARTWYAKQLAQEAVMEVARLPIRANEISAVRETDLRGNPEWLLLTRN